jgi:hypothetical protein
MTSNQGQQAALQGHRRVVLAGVQPGVVDVHRRSLGQVADQPHVGLIVRPGLLGPGEPGRPQGDAPGGQRHHYERVHAPVQQGLHVTGCQGGLQADLPHLGRVPRQQGLPPQERRRRPACGRPADQVAHGEVDRGRGRGVAHRNPAEPQRVWADVQRIFPLQHRVEQVDDDPVGELGHGQGRELLRRAVNIEGGPDLAAGPLQQVKTGVSMPQGRGRPDRTGDIGEGSHRPEHPAVVRHPVRRPGEDPALAIQGPLQVHADHGNTVHHLPGEGALDQVHVHDAVGHVGL